MIDHCILAMRSQDHSQCSSHVVQGELLPKIDDDIDSVLGLTVFYDYVQSSMMSQAQSRKYVSAFTTELFAYYLHSRLLSVHCPVTATETPLPSLSDINLQCEHAQCIFDMKTLFIGGVLVLKLLNSALIPLKLNISKANRRKCPADVDIAAMDTSKLVELLQKSAIEHLTTYRQLEARDFGSVATIVTADFGALYAYKRGDYQRCLLLSTQNVHGLLYATRTADVLNGFEMPYIPTFPEFIQLMDDDIVSVVALILIISPNCRKPNSKHSLFSVTMIQLTLSLYLMTRCQLKLRYPVTSLVQTINCINATMRRYPVEATLNRLVLKLAKSKAISSVRMATGYC